MGGSTFRGVVSLVWCAPPYYLWMGNLCLTTFGSSTFLSKHRNGDCWGKYHQLLSDDSAKEKSNLAWLTSQVRYINYPEQAAPRRLSHTACFLESSCPRCSTWTQGPDICTGSERYQGRSFRQIDLPFRLMARYPHGEPPASRILCHLAPHSY